MTTRILYPYQLVAFHSEAVTKKTAHQYRDLLEKAMTPVITVEKRRDKRYNIIGGFKYIDGVHSLRKNPPLLCTIVDSFASEKERKLATLQCCLERNEKTEYKELLIYELTHDYKMSEHDIALAVGRDSDKIKKYMYRQVIPYSYYKRANELGVKNLVQAIYLANSFALAEKQILTELCLTPNESLRFKRKHLPIYKKYRKRYPLFEDFNTAKKQITQAIHIENATNEYWKFIPNPLNHDNIFSTLDEDEYLH